MNPISRWWRRLTSGRVDAILADHDLAEALRTELPAEAERLTAGMPHLATPVTRPWPDGCEPLRPCCFEDNWTCLHHRPRGRHHAPPSGVTIATVTDLAARRHAVFSDGTS